MGKIELDHTGSGSGVTLSSDGTDLLLDGTAIGGGGGAALELYAENPSSPTANTVTGTNSAAIGSNLTVSGNSSLAAGTGGTATGYSSFAFGDGADATGNHSVAMGGGAIQASGPQSIAIGYGSDATNSDAHAFGRNANASGSSATALGRDAVASTTRAVALGDSRAGGVDSLAAAIANNSSSYGATGANSVAIGDRSKATASRSIAISGFGAIASGTESVAIGYSADALEEGSLALGKASVSNSRFGVAIGQASTQGVRYRHAYGGNRFSSTGDCQAGLFILKVATTDATPDVLCTNTSAPSSINQVVLPNNSAYAFHGTIVARQQASAGTASAAWKVEGLIRREGSAGTTVLVNSATTVLDNTPSWGLALSADTTNGGLKIEATGAASTNIRWVATIHTSEVTYA